MSKRIAASQMTIFLLGPAGFDPQKEQQQRIPPQKHPNHKNNSIYGVKKFSIFGTQSLKTTHKYYAVDMGLRLINIVDFLLHRKDIMLT